MLAQYFVFVTFCYIDRTMMELHMICLLPALWNCEGRDSCRSVNFQRWPCCGVSSMDCYPLVDGSPSKAFQVRVDVLVLSPRSKYYAQVPVQVLKYNHEPKYKHKDKHKHKYKPFTEAFRLVIILSTTTSITTSTSTRSTTSTKKAQVQTQAQVQAQAQS